jgi:Uma2 family endonuclease
VSQAISHPRLLIAQPVWDLAYLFPSQGAWSDEDFLALESTRLIELSDGEIEVLPMPTEEHQTIVLFLYALLRSFVEPRKLGKVLIAPFPVLLWENKYREPDLMFMLRKHARRRTNRFWRGADLVMEVVSRSRKDRGRDLRIKRAEYARAGIPEYWIVDLAAQSITVLALEDGVYTEAGIYSAKDSDIAKSPLLADLRIPVADLFRETSR